MPGGGKQNSGLSCFCCFWCNNHGKIPGGAGCAPCVCPSVCPVCSCLVSCCLSCVLPSPSCRHQRCPGTCWVSEGAAIGPGTPDWHSAASPVCAALPSPSCHHPLVSVLSLCSHLHPSISMLPALSLSLPVSLSQPALPGLISPCSPSPACSDGQEAPFGEGIFNQHLPRSAGMSGHPEGLSSRSAVVSVCSPGVWQMRLGSPSSLASSQKISCRLLLRFLLPFFLPDGWR